MTSMQPTNSGDFDEVSGRVRAASATQLAKLIERMQPLVDACLDDPAALWDAEPARLVAQTGLLKLQAQLIRDLGALYQVNKPPRERVDPNLVPLERVEAMLSAQQQVAEERQREAVRAAVEATRADMQERERLSLEAARERVTGALSRLRDA